ncbi:MAG: hypothetical protein M1820_010434 [Bogoriella megaspora]|nr:MAG: hypothetical protein M1820_010434 [Bogoriella megaspora]
MPVNYFHKADADASPNERQPKQTTRRLSKPRTMQNSARGPQQNQNDSPTSARYSGLWEDDAVIETFSGVHRSRPSTRDLLRLQLFSERKSSSSIMDEDSPQETQRTSMGDRAANRLSIPRESRASPALSSPGGSKISLSPDGEFDLSKALSMLQEMKKSASPEDLAILHKALFSPTDDDSPVSSSASEHTKSLTSSRPGNSTIRRRSLQQVPGVATRPDAKPTNRVSLSHETSSETMKSYLRESSEPPPVPRHRPQSSVELGPSTPFTHHTTNDRAATPSSSHDYGVLSGPGNLRITNGAASPDSMLNTRRVLHRAQRSETDSQLNQYPLKTQQTSTQQYPNFEGDGQEETTSEHARRNPGHSRDEGYFTASDHGTSSKDATPYTEERGRLPRQLSADISTLPSQAKTHASPATPKSTNRIGHGQTRSGSPFPATTQNVDDNELSRTNDNSHFDEDVGHVNARPNPWPSSPKADEYLQEIGSNPYADGDDSREVTPTPRASPANVRGAIEAGQQQGHRRGLSRTPEEALRQLIGEGGTNSPNQAVSSTQSPIETLSAVKVAHPQIVQRSEEQPRQAETQEEHEEGVRKSDSSSVKKDSGYTSEASLAPQGPQSMKSKDKNPNAPRPIEGGTFGKPMPFTAVRPDMLRQGSESSVVRTPTAAVYGSQAKVEALAQAPRPRSKSIKLRPSLWFSRRGSTSTVDVSYNASTESLASTMTSGGTRKPKKLQKSRPLSVTLAVTQEETVSRPASPDKQEITLNKHETLSRAMSTPTVPQSSQEDELEMRVRRFAQRNNSGEAISQVPNQSSDSRFRKSVDVQSVGASVNSVNLPVEEIKPQRRKSIFGRGKSPVARSMKLEALGRPLRRAMSSEDNNSPDGFGPDADILDDDFGTTAQTLGTSPYDVAMSRLHERKAAWGPSGAQDMQRFQNLGLAPQSSTMPHPHQVSNAHVRRPKSLFSMNEEQASSYARMKSRDRAEMLGKPGYVDHRDMPVSSGPARPKGSMNAVIQQRPQSMYEAHPGAPPMPTMPNLSTFGQAGGSSNVEQDESERTASAESTPRKSLDRSKTDGQIPTLPQMVQALRKVSPASLSEETQHTGWPGWETPQRMWRERRKSIARRDQSQPPSPIQEEENSPRPDSAKLQPTSTKPRKQSPNNIRGKEALSPILKSALARKSSEEPRSPEKQAHSQPPAPKSYYPQTQEEHETRLSREAERGLQVYPEFAHLIDVRASAKNQRKATERPLTSRTGATTTSIDAVLAPTAPPSVTPAARAAFMQTTAKPTHASVPASSPLREEQNAVTPMPRRQIHPQARSQNQAATHMSDSNNTASQDLTSLESKSHSRPSSSDASLLNRYSGGLHYAFERGLGVGGSAGTREGGEANRASWKGVQDRRSWGIDLGDVPVIVQGK